MRTKTRKPRNAFVVHAIKRKAGSHQKPYKSLRGRLNRDGWDG